MTENNIFDFIKQHDLMLLATSVDDHPEAAVVEFGEIAEKGLIIFDTLATSRKYKNLQTNPRVAAVIGWNDSVTVQLEGEAVELSGQECEEAKTAYFAKNPRAKKWENRENIAYFAIKINWMRYSDLNTDPWLIEEKQL